MCKQNKVKPIKTLYLIPTLTVFSNCFCALRPPPLPSISFCHCIKSAWRATSSSHPCSTISSMLCSNCMDSILYARKVSHMAGERWEQSCIRYEKVGKCKKRKRNKMRKKKKEREKRKTKANRNTKQNRQELKKNGEGEKEKKRKRINCFLNRTK